MYISFFTARGKRKRDVRDFSKETRTGNARLVYRKRCEGTIKNYVDMLISYLIWFAPSSVYVGCPPRKNTYRRRACEEIMRSVWSMINICTRRISRAIIARHALSLQLLSTTIDKFRICPELSFCNSFQRT